MGYDSHIWNWRRKLEMSRGAEIVARNERSAMISKWTQERRIFLQFLSDERKQIEKPPSPCPYVSDLARWQGCIIVQVGDEYFYDRAENFPTELLFARVTLALDAGEDRRVFPKGMMKRYG